MEFFPAGIHFEGLAALSHRAGGEVHHAALPDLVLVQRLSPPRAQVAVANFKKPELQNGLPKRRASASLKKTGCGSRMATQNRTLVSGNMDQNLWFAPPLV